MGQFADDYEIGSNFKSKVEQTTNNALIDTEAADERYLMESSCRDKKMINNTQI